MLGEGPLTPDLKRLAAELAIDQRVDFLGRAEPSQIAEVLRESDVFVLSSLSENMPSSRVGGPQLRDTGRRD